MFLDVCLSCYLWPNIHIWLYKRLYEDMRFLQESNVLQSPVRLNVACGLIYRYSLTYEAISDWICNCCQ